MRTTIDIPEPLLHSVKRLATKQRVTLSAVVGDALQAHLAKRPDKILKPFRLHTVAGRLKRPDLDLDRSSALLLEDDEAAFRPSH